MIRGQTHGKEKQFPGIIKLKVTHPQSQTGVSEVLNNDTFLSSTLVVKQLLILIVKNYYKVKINISLC